MEDAVLVYELRQSTGSAADTELDLKMPRSINNLIEHLREFFQLVLHKQLTMAQLGAQMSTAAQLDTFSNESATSRRNAPRSNRENFSNVFPTQSLPGRSIDVEQTNPRSLPSNLFGGGKHTIGVADFWFQSLIFAFFLSSGQTGSQDETGESSKVGRWFAASDGYGSKYLVLWKCRLFWHRVFLTGLYTCCKISNFHFVRKC